MIETGCFPASISPTVNDDDGRRFFKLQAPPPSLSPKAMVRPLEVRLVCASGYTRGPSVPKEPLLVLAPYSPSQAFEIPGLRTKEIAEENAHLDWINRIIVSIDFQMPKQFPLEQTCYVMYGGNTVGDLADLVRARLSLGLEHPISFFIDGVMLPQDIHILSISKKYVDDLAMFTLGCRFDKVKKAYNVDKSVKVPVIDKDHIIEEGIPFPPRTIRSIRDARRASQLGKVGWYPLKDGTLAVLQHGSFGEGGSFQF